MYCSCSLAVTYLCDNCFIPHRNKSPALVHGTATIEVANFPQYFQRCQRFSQGKEELLGNIERMDQCCAELFSTVETLISQILQYRDDFIAQMQVVKGEMERDIQGSIEETEASLGQEKVELRGKYSAALRDFVEHSLTLFNYQIDCSQVHASLQSIIQMQLCQPKQPSSPATVPSVPQIPQIPLESIGLYWITEKSIQSFDVRTEHLRPPVQLSTTIQADLNSRWAVVDNARVVLCGGGQAETKESLARSGHMEPRKTAYMLGTTGKVEALPDLKYGHESPGVIVWKNAVLVFGSQRGPGGRKCESLTLTGFSWETLTEMHKRRHGFTPAIWRNEVYLCGGAHNCTVEVFDGVSIKVLEIRFPEGIQCMACVRGDTLVVLSVNYQFVLSRTQGNEAPIYHHKTRRGKGAQSYTLPVLWNEVIYSFDEDGDICKYSAETGNIID